MFKCLSIGRHVKKKKKRWHIPRHSIWKFEDCKVKIYVEKFSFLTHANMWIPSSPTHTRTRKTNRMLVHLFVFPKHVSPELCFVSRIPGDQIQYNVVCFFPSDTLHMGANKNIWTEGTWRRIIIHTQTTDQISMYLVSSKNKFPMKAGKIHLNYCLCQTGADKYFNNLTH